MERPVIVNSLLCFIHNYRARKNIRSMVQEYFPIDAINDAKAQLQRRVTPIETLSLPADILDLFDVISSREDIVYATTDLTNLPLALPSNESGEILKEIKDLRTYIITALDGKPEEVHSRDSTTPTVTCKFTTSASSPEFPAALPQVCTIREESPKTTRVSSPLEDLEFSVEAQTMTATSYTRFPGTATKRKAGRSLDAAVKKLSEKRQAEVEEPEEASSQSAWQPSIDPQAYLNMIRMMQAPQTNIMNSVMGQIQQLNGQTLSENDADEREDMADDGDGEDSSPSPSEDNRDDFPMLEMSIDCESDKPFVCQHQNCQKRFANKFLLKKHQFIHTGLRPHTCPYCSKRFNRKDNLLRHKKTHIQNGDPLLIHRNGLPDTINGLFPGLARIPSTEINKMEQEEE